MSVHVNVDMSKITHTPIKVGVRTYAMYSNCQNLGGDFAQKCLVCKMKKKHEEKNEESVINR